jgi:hypothetical protein
LPPRNEEIVSADASTYYYDKAIETEVDRVWWKDARGEDGYVYWANKTLAPDARPMGGVK